VRSLTAGVQTEIAGEIVRPIRLVDLDFPSGILYITDAPMDIVFNGNTYLGVGDLGSIGVMTESSNQQANGITLTLSGISPTQNNINILLAEHYQGRSCKIYHAFLDDNHVLVPSPVMDGEFIMDEPTINLGTTATITIAAESILIGWSRATLLRYTDEDQQRLHPGDKFLGGVSKAAEEKIDWP